MSRIAETFASLNRPGRGGFIPFIVAGDPDLATTGRLLIELAAAGADIIEFSAHPNARCGMESACGTRSRARAKQDSTLMCQSFFLAISIRFCNWEKNS
jgi:hypothetical protein